MFETALLQLYETEIDHIYEKTISFTTSGPPTCTLISLLRLDDTVFAENVEMSNLWSLIWIPLEGIKNLLKCSDMSVQVLHTHQQHEDVDTGEEVLVDLMTDGAVDRIFLKHGGHHHTLLLHPKHVRVNHSCNIITNTDPHDECSSVASRVSCGPGSGFSPGVGLVAMKQSRVCLRGRH